MAKQRIGILDGFRTIAILSVMLYHYYSRWAPPNSTVSLYPYGNQYSYFGLGYLGVEFFFIISGFVIFYTLEFTPTIVEFWKKRLIRLYPALVIISIITFLFFEIFDKETLFPKSHSLLNFQFSLSMLDPQLFNLLFAHWHLKFYYLDASFWSLWPEVKFYLLASILFYYNKEKFIRNFIALMLAMLIVHWGFIELYWFMFHTLPTLTPDVAASGYPVWLNTGIRFIWNCFSPVTNLPQYWIHFALGVIYYALYNDKHIGKKPSIPMLAVLMLFIVFQCTSAPDNSLIINLTMNALFLCFIYLPNLLGFLDTKYISRVGVVSYIIYLFHENIGVWLIHTFGNYSMPYGFVLPIILIIFFIFISLIYNKYIDLKISRFLKHLLLKKEKQQ